MCKGAQHKVYGTMCNILGPVSLIRYTRVGTDSSGHLRPHEASAVIAITRDRHSGYAATAFVHVRAHLRTNANTEPSSVLNHEGGGEHGSLDNGRITRCEHGRPTRTRPPNDLSATSEPSLIARTRTAAATRTTTSTPKSWPCCCWPHCCCSHHLHHSSEILRPSGQMQV